MRFASVLVMVSLSSSVLIARNKIEKFVDKYQIKPLAESEYWKQNPGVLPYEECKLFSSKGERVKSRTQTVGVGVHKHVQKFTIFCYSKSLKVGYQIPILLDKDLTIGAGIDINVLNYSKGELLWLNNKNLTDIYGNYKGGTVGLGVGTTLSGSALFHNGIALTMDESGGATILKALLGFRKIHVGTRALNEEEIYQPYYLQKRGEYLEMSNQRFEHIFKNGGADKYLRRLDEEGAELQTWDDERKYNRTWKFWIHHLKPADFDHQQCQQKHQQEECNTEQLEYVRLFGELDLDFLSTLSFRNISRAI